MSKAVETYKGKKIGQCTCGYHVGYKHFLSVEGARKYIDGLGGDHE